LLTTTLALEAEAREKEKGPREGKETWGPIGKPADWKGKQAGIRRVDESRLMGKKKGRA